MVAMEGIGAKAEEGTECGVSGHALRERVAQVKSLSLIAGQPTGKAQIDPHWWKKRA